MKGTNRVFRLGTLALALAFMVLAAGITACSNPEALAKRFYELDMKRNNNSATAQELEDWGEIRGKRIRWAKEFVAKMDSEKGVDMANDPSVIFEDTLEKLQSGELTLDGPARTTRTEAVAEPQKTAAQSDESASAGAAPEETAEMAAVTNVNAAPESDFSVGLTASGNGVVITGYTGPGGAVVIPAVIQGYPVREIGDMAFFGCGSLTTITLPGSVTTIGYSAFSASSLASITIPDSVKVISDGAFSGCESLTAITLPDGVTTIGDSVFYGCKSLASVTLPGSVKTIGSNAFFYCESLTAITLPGSVTTIGYGAFSGCAKLSLASQSALRAAGYKGSF